MGYALCPCGNHISDTALPNDQVAMLVPGAITEEFDGIGQFYDDIPQVYECDKCGRLGVFVNNYGRWYSPDDGWYGKVAADRR